MWYAHVYANGKRSAWGGYSSEQEAAIARDRVVLAVRPSAPLNFPDEARALGPSTVEELRRELAANGARNLTRTGVPRRKPAREPENVPVGPPEKPVGARVAAYLDIDGGRVYLGTWPNALDAVVARDRLVLYLGRTSTHPLRARQLSTALGPASADELRRLATLTLKKDRMQSSFIGVQRQGKRFAAVLSEGGANTYIGTYDKEHQAAEAYDRLARHRGLPKLNFPRRPLHAMSLEELQTERRRFHASRRSTPYTGVSLFSHTLRKPWHAQIKVGGRAVSLGYWASDREAALARDRAALHFGFETAALNFPNEARALGAADPDTIRAAAKASGRRPLTA